MNNASHVTLRSCKIKDFYECYFLLLYLFMDIFSHVSYCLYKEKTKYK